MTFRTLFAVCMLAAAWPAVAPAQAPDAARRAAAKEMMQVAGAASQFEQVMPLMAGQLSETFKNLAPDKAAEIDDVLRQLMPRFMHRKNELLDQIAGLYAAELDLDELKGIVAFYKSPAGAKFASVQPGILRQSMVIGQRWGRSIGSEFAEEVRRELKKRGIDL
jgi:hypothetical protein